MEIRVSGHQIETGEALQERVTDRMNAIADKYFSRTIGANVVFKKGPHDSFQCDIVAHVMQGLVLKAHGQAQEAPAAFQVASDKIEKQLRRYMRRLKDRTGGPAAPEYKPLMDDNASYTVFETTAEEDQAADAPLIVAETRVDIPESSVSDAVMMLDLRDTNALLFLNSKTRAHNMVYRRHDGTIGWVEPQ